MTGVTRRIVFAGLLLALSVVGAFFKLGVYSIAFDSAAGFVAALLLGPGMGAVICSLGHLAAAAATGFPLTPPFHLLIAVTMAGVGAAGGLVARRLGLLVGTATLVVANGVVAPALLALVPNPMGTGLFQALVIPLTLAAAANAAVAFVVVKALQQMGMKAL